MENKKTFNLINIILVCIMITFVAIPLFIFFLSPNLFSVYTGFLFGLLFIIPLTIINAVKFIVEGIKTFNKNDELAPSNKELTGGNKTLKIIFTVINILLIYATVLVVLITSAQSNSSTFYSCAIYSVFVLVPFAVFNTIKFLIFGNKSVFEENYKKPFKTVYIAGNFLLICAMMIHIAINVITNKLELTEVLMPAIFYTFLLSVFNGIKFIIDDIKSVRKNEQERKLFWQSKIKKTAAVISAIILCGATSLVTVFWYTHPTHYSYNDIWIVGKTTEQIEQRYGEYDTEERGEFGYFSRGYLVKKSKYSWRKTYYMIKFDDEGIAYDTEVVND